ncbi:hypothetical protein GCM10027403_15750 [Arthrobacter tecti]
MRKVGFGVIGLICGLLAGFIAHDLLAPLLLANGGSLRAPLPLAILMGLLTPVLAAVGIVVGVLIDSRTAKHPSRGAC